MSFTHLSNVAKGKNFMNKSAKLLHDLIRRIFISPLVIYVDKIVLERYILCN
jgi:hypothetical protein